MGTSKNQEAASGAAVKKRGQFKEIWRRLKKNKMAMIGLGIVALLVLISIFADFLFDYNTVVIKQNTAIRLQTPSAAHWLGTDEIAMASIKLKMLGPSADPIVMERRRLGTARKISMIRMITLSIFPP